MSPFGERFSLVWFLHCAHLTSEFEQEPLLGTIRLEYQTSVPLNCMVLIQYHNLCIPNQPIRTCFFCKTVRVSPKRKSNPHLKQVITLLLIQACVVITIFSSSLPPFILSSFLHKFLFLPFLLPSFLSCFFPSFFSPSSASLPPSLSVFLSFVFF